MRFKITYITVLFLSLALGVSAQKKKSKAKQPAKTYAKAKATKKPAKAAKKAVKEKEPEAKTASKDTATLKGATIEILQSYKPEVKLAPKPEAAPALPPVDISTPKLQYNVPPQSLYYTYNSLPLRPLTLGKDSVAKGFENYVKFGGGNLSTTFLDAGFGSLHNAKYESAFHVHHLSMAGNIEGQKTAQTGIEANATFHTGKNDLHTGLDIYRDQYNYYGFALPGRVSPKIYSGVKLAVGLMPAARDKKFFYDPTVRFLFHGDNDQRSDKQFSLDLPFSYQRSEELKLYAGVKAVYDNLSGSVYSSYNNYILQISPGFEYAKGAFTGKVGLYPTIGTNNVYLLPDIDARFRINGTQVSIFAGWKGLLKQNNFADVSAWNPYVWNNQNFQQTHVDELFGGIQTNLGNHFVLAGRVSFWHYDNMLMFINDTLADKSRFLSVYDKVDAVSLQASVRYHVANTFSLGFSGIYTGFNAKNFRHVWHEPGVRFNADMMIRPMPELTITGYLSVMDEMYALNNGNQSIKMETAFDLGAGAEYTFIPRLSAFIQFKNILNSRYERWYGYQVYGFNVFGGLRFKF